MNPNAKVFIPSMISKTIVLRPSLKTDQLAQLDALSTSVAENILRPMSHRELEQNLLQKIQKAKSVTEIIPSVTEITRIPKVTCFDDLEQVAQIVYNHQTGRNIFELLWDKEKHKAILNCSACSWEVPNVTIRDIIHDHFDDEYHVNILNESKLLDQLVSSAPAVVVHIQPVFYEELDWKIQSYKKIKK